MATFITTIKFTQQGGIQLSLSASPNENVAITISDSGPGIPEERLPDIFEAFVTTRLDSKGTGLGLTVAEGIVQQHGGAITASNRAVRAVRSRTANAVSEYS